MKQKFLVIITFLLVVISMAFTQKEPKVLIIGDSISIGYTPYVEQALSGKAEVFHNPGNAQHSGVGLNNIEEWIGDTDWDVIQFNWGLWDLCYRLQGNRDKINGKITLSLEDYRANLDAIITILKNKTNAKLVFVTTSFVPENEDGRFPEDVERYNTVAREVMKKHDIYVNDIYEKSVSIHKKYGEGTDDVHYTKTGYAELSKEIIPVLKQLLGVEDVNPKPSDSQPFVVTYKFDNTLSSSTLSGAESFIAKDAEVGGTKLVSHSFSTEGSAIAWKGEVKTNAPNFVNNFLRMDILPQDSYAIKIDSIKLRQKMSKTGGAYNFAVGCTVNGTLPLEGASASTRQSFTADFSEYTYYPTADNASAEGFNNISAWVSARGLNAEVVSWYIDDITIYGTYANKEEESSTIVVSADKKQKIRLGIDAERLWYWRSGIKSQLAKAAVGDLKVEYARVAINASYELEQGLKNEAAYKDILEVMTVFREANPNLHFFASPRPLMESYSSEERVQQFGHVDNVPWSPYPLWIQKWVQNGTTTMGDGTVVPKWEKGDFDVDALVQYYADYLNLMKTKGFDIEYIDLSNEQTIITPAYSKYIFDNLPSKLASGVKMPKIVVPSTWDVQGGTEWLKRVDKTKDEHLSFEIAAAHNTGSGTPSVYEAFVSEAQALGKEAWNSELHEWTGVELHDEIINSSIFWEHMRAGFTGIDTWLFFGPGGGKPHSMIFAFPGRYVTTGKYEIFKQIVNNSNGGNYVEISQPFSSTPTSAFLKDNILSIWILNKNARLMSDVLFKLPDWVLESSQVEVMKWHKDLPKEGTSTIISLPSNEEFRYDIDGESLYYFKIKVEAGSSLNNSIPFSVTDFKIHANLISETILIQALNASETDYKGSYSIINMQGQLLEEGKLAGEYTEVSTEGLSSGVYIVSISYGDQKFNKKVLIK